MLRGSEGIRKRRTVTSCEWKISETRKSIHESRASSPYGERGAFIAVWKARSVKRDLGISGIHTAYCGVFEYTTKKTPYTDVRKDEKANRPERKSIEYVNAYSP